MHITEKCNGLEMRNMADNLFIKNDIWNDIISDYQKARFCLWCPEHSNEWHREENEGYYFLWKAYHFATNAENKRPLWYARILYMMACEQRYKQSPYILLHQYLKPCITAYRKAETSSEQPTEKEVNDARYMYDQYSYEFSCRSSSEEAYQRAYSLIEGYNDDIDFQFHDSKVIEFSHTATTAKLILEYNDITATLIFNDVDEIEIKNVEPDIAWIFDFYCYPAFPTNSRIVFDIGYYKIQCGHIRIEYDSL